MKEHRNLTEQTQVVRVLWEVIRATLLRFEIHLFESLSVSLCCLSLFYWILFRRNPTLIQVVMALHRRPKQLLSSCQLLPCSAQAPAPRRCAPPSKRPAAAPSMRPCEPSPPRVMDCCDASFRKPRMLFFRPGLPECSRRGVPSWGRQAVSLGSWDHAKRERQEKMVWAVANIPKYLVHLGSGIMSVQPCSDGKDSCRAGWVTFTPDLQSDRT